MATKYRITVEVLRSGQPRPYADTEFVCRVTFEETKWNDPSYELHPWPMTIDTALRYLEKVDGWVGTDRRSSGYLDTYLDYFIMCEPIVTAADLIKYGDPNSKMSHIWEFRTVSPYTD
jgi:hypothetical protein